jgi:glycosyltransferase involved in cell wall biosynthesis
MKISVALCTYNGEKFLSAQLTSILHQSLTVDEIVVCDDGSSDSTLKILQSLAVPESLKFKIFSNGKNLGVKKKF